MKTKSAFYTLIILLGLLSLGALFGGGALIISPSGELLRMPLSNLGSAPFKDFFVPGFILFSVLGVMPGILIYALIKKPKCNFCEYLNFFKDMHWAWSFYIYVSFALIIWIQVEMIYLQTVIWVHTFYIVYALVMIFLAILPTIRFRYKKEQAL
jgi:hypothetical protein